MIFTFQDKIRQNKNSFSETQKMKDSAKPSLWLGWNETAHSSNSAKNSSLAKLEAFNVPDTE